MQEHSIIGSVVSFKHNDKQQDGVLIDKGFTNPGMNEHRHETYYLVLTLDSKVRKISPEQITNCLVSLCKPVADGISWLESFRQAEK